MIETTEIRCKKDLERYIKYHIPEGTPNRLQMALDRLALLPMNKDDGMRIIENEIKVK